VGENDEVLKHLREIRDLQRQELDLIRERYVQHDIERKEWLDSNEKRYAQIRDE